MNRLIRLNEVCTRTGLGRTTIYRMMGSDKFPRQIILGERCVAWVESEIEQWLAERIEQSRVSEIS